MRILGPVALLLLILLSAFTLFSYRSAVGLLVEERRDEALTTARALAGQLARGEATADAAGLSRLRRTAPGVRSLTLLDADRGELAVAGEVPGAGALAPFAELAPFGEAGTSVEVPPGGIAVGPGDPIPGAVAALVPLSVGGEARLLRLDLPAPVLGSQVRALVPLTWLVLGVGAAVGLLVLLFLRHLMGPYETLLARARQLGEAGSPEGDEDEIEFLVRTFERGIAALVSEPGGEGSAAGEGEGAELAALEQTLGESLESGLLVLDREGRVLALNPVGAQLLGVAPPAPGLPLGEALAPHPRLVDLLSEAVATGRPLSRREVETVRPGEGDGPGTEVTLGLTVHALRSGPAGGGPGPGSESASGRTEARRVRGFLVLFADLTDARRQADEARLAESLVQLGEMAAGVAHELRNSLTTVRGYLSLIERQPGEPARDHLREVRRETDHLQRVLEDFLAFARPGSARLEEVALGVVVRRAAADPTLESAEVRVDDARLEPGLRLHGDPELLERALRNLVRNAVQAAAEAASGERLGPAVEIGVRRDDEGIEITVEDRGPGVPLHLRDRLFHPFVTGRPDGVGLGLALTQRIVALHGGSVRLEDRPGGGTTARVRFPRGAIVT